MDISAPVSDHKSEIASRVVRHSAMVRSTHWMATLCFFALLLSGAEILVSHPRFYWGETGNVRMPALFVLPIPASRAAVNTGYGFVLPDQNGWSRSLHFQAAWIIVLTGLFYLVAGVCNGHVRRNLLPAGNHLRWPVLIREMNDHLRLRPPGPEGSTAYNVLQRIAYTAVIFVLFPLIVWTGLAMSPALTAAFPGLVTFWGGQQSARTLHFLFSVLLVVFVLGHVGMVWRAGFRSRVWAMVMGRTPESSTTRKEQR